MRRHQRSFWLLFTLMVLILTGRIVIADDTPTDQVALFANYVSGKNDLNLIAIKILAPPAKATHIAHTSIQDYPNPHLFDQAAVVAIGRMDNTTPWTDEQIAQVEQYVRQGGHLIMISAAPLRLAGEGRDLSRLQTLLGAAYWGGSRKGMAIELPEHPLMQGIESRDYVWLDAGTPLCKLNTAEAVVGNDEGAALVTVNELGQGRVTYFGVEISRLPGDREQDVAAYARLLESAIVASAPAEVRVDRKGWGLEPLGPEATPLDQQAPNPPQQRELEPTLKAMPTQGEPVELLREGEPVFALVTAQDPTTAARRAAQELARAFERMTGQAPPIHREGELDWSGQGATLRASGTQSTFNSVIVVGDSQVGRAQELDPETLPTEGYRLQTLGSVLFVVGDDRTPSGKVLNGAVSLLERHVGFRWLWPGPLGEVVPEHAALAVGPLIETDAPAIRQRKMRNNNTASIGAGAPAQRGGVHDMTNLTAPADPNAQLHPRSLAGLENLGVKNPKEKTFVIGTGSWFYHQRLGSSLKLRYTHAYGQMWERFGESHPEWFSLQPNGTREQNPSRERLCVANQALADQASKDVIARLEADPTLKAASVSPNDGSAANSFCMCTKCRKLDPPTGPQIDLMFTINGARIHRSYPSLTDRYLTFYNRIARQVAKRLPERWVGAYAYSAYRAPPLDVQVEPNVLIGFVGLGYFNDHALERDRRSWNGWANKSSLLMLRPNLFHGGQGFLANYVHKLGRDIKHCYQTGMVAADFDSVMNHWSTQGLNYYVLSKLLWDPSQDVDAVVQDYCENGFGLAASAVRRYFDRIEELTSQAAASVGEKTATALRAEERADAGLFDLGPLSEAYTPKVVKQLRSLLEQAREAVADDPIVLARIDFLERGLDFTEYQARLIQMYEHREQADPELARQLLDERYRLYMKILRDDPLVLNVAWHHWREGPYLGRAFDWKPPGTGKP